MRKFFQDFGAVMRVLGVLEFQVEDLSGIFGGL